MSDRDDDIALFCHRCACRLHPGRDDGAGDFYVVKIESYADPSPPRISADDLERRDLQSEMAKLIASMADRSPRELSDDVYRTMVLHLCGPCYRQWIENPTG